MGSKGGLKGSKWVQNGQNEFEMIYIYADSNGFRLVYNGPNGSKGSKEIQMVKMGSNAFRYRHSVEIL